MKKISLEDYLFKNVVITCTDGSVYRGYVDDYDYEDYNDETEEEEDSIGLKPYKGEDNGMFFFRSDIADIRLDEQA